MAGATIVFAMFAATMTVVRAARHTIKHEAAAAGDAEHVATAIRVSKTKDFLELGANDSEPSMGHVNSSEPSSAGRMGFVMPLLPKPQNPTMALAGPKPLRVPRPKPLSPVLPSVADIAKKQSQLTQHPKSWPFNFWPLRKEPTRQEGAGVHRPGSLDVELMRKDLASFNVKLWKIMLSWNYEFAGNIALADADALSIMQNAIRRSRVSQDELFVLKERADAQNAELLVAQEVELQAHRALISFRTKEYNYLEEATPEKIRAWIQMESQLVRDLESARSDVLQLVSAVAEAEQLVHATQMQKQSIVEVAAILLSRKTMGDVDFEKMNTVSFGESPSTFFGAFLRPKEQISDAEEAVKRVEKIQKTLVKKEADLYVQTSELEKNRDHEQQLLEDYARSTEAPQMWQVSPTHKIVLVQAHIAQLSRNVDVAKSSMESTKMKLQAAVKYAEMALARADMSVFNTQCDSDLCLLGRTALQELEQQEVQETKPHIIKSSVAESDLSAKSLSDSAASVLAA